MTDMEGQVDKLNASSNIEDWLVRYGYSGNNRQLSINSVSVTDSENVHFGDRTYYEGPVVIKQYILVDDEDEELDAELESVILDNTDDDAQRHELVKKESSVECSSYEVTGDFMTVSGSEHREISILTEGIDGEPPVVTVSNSSEVHFGKQVHYKGPVTIERLVRSKSKTDFHAIESKLWLNGGTDASAKHLSVVSRIEWLSRSPAQELYDFIHPVPYVVINHTATTNCTNRLECIHYVRSFQSFHMETRQWYDIGYNFLIGADGNVYEGRGWHKVGAHTKFYNETSIGIAFIGTFHHVNAPKQQIASFMKLMREGVRKGFIAKNYKLLAARQLRPTESPGKALYEQMKKWPHWYRTLEITEL